MSQLTDKLVHPIPIDMSISENEYLRLEAKRELDIAKRRASRCKLHKLNPRINATLLYLIREKIRISPDEFDMSRWQSFFYINYEGRKASVEYAEDVHMAEALKHPCGTAACIAGWAVKIANTKAQPLSELHIDKPYYESICNKAAYLLGLGPEQAHALFFSDYWHLRIGISERQTPKAAISYLNMILGGKVPLFNTAE